jgi:flagellar protein FlaJ
MNDKTEDDNVRELEAKHRDRMKFESIESQSWIKKFDGAAYGVFGEFYSKRKDKFSGLELSLKKAKMSAEEDLYMSRITLGSFLISFSLLILSILLGVISFLIFGFSIVLSLLIGFLLFMLSFIISMSVGYYYPTYKSNQRGKKIDQSLPHAVTFMYAMSRGGVNLVDIVRKLSENEVAYSETATEYKSVVREMEFFSKDIQQALDTASRRSPSEKFTSFNDDLTSVLTSGGDLTSFLYDKSEEYLDEARKQQERFIETLALMSEVYVTAFVAAPLFLIIITVILNMLGGGGGSGSNTRLYLIVYGMLPIAMFIFYVAISTISSDQEKITDSINYNKKGLSYSNAKEKYGHLKTGKDNSIEKIFQEKKKRQRREIIKNPLETLTKKPETTLYITAPISITIALISFVIIQPSVETLINQSTKTTFFLFVLPVLVMVTPLSILFEYRQRKKQRIMDRFPGTLKQLASSNSIGLNLQESLDLVSRNTKGLLGTEMKKVRNDMNWDYDLNKALLKFADNMKLATMTRTVKLITEANRSTGDISKVLEVASEDVKQRRALKKERYTQMTLYTAVLIMSFGVYLLVIGILDVTFLTQISELGSSTGGLNASQQAQSSASVSQLNLQDTPIELYRMIFLHSAIIEAIGSGLLAGYLGSNDIRYGLKYTIILLIITMIVFTVI